MVLTNIAVAEQIAVNFPEQALLRRNDLPLERRLVCDIFVIPLQCADPPRRKHSRSERRVLGTRSMLLLPSVS